MEHVACFLHRLKLGQHVAKFEENNVDGTLLVNLTDDDLIDLGIDNRLARKRLLLAIKKDIDSGHPDVRPEDTYITVKTVDAMAREAGQEDDYVDIDDIRDQVHERNAAAVASAPPAPPVQARPPETVRDDTTEEMYQELPGGGATELYQELPTRARDQHGVPGADVYQEFPAPAEPAIYDSAQYAMAVVELQRMFPAYGQDIIERTLRINVVCLCVGNVHTEPIMFFYCFVYAYVVCFVL